MSNGSLRDIRTTTWEDIASEIPHGADGYTAKEIFESTRGCVAYTYDDLILMPGENL
jgi:hypothetical protein